MIGAFSNRWTMEMTSDLRFVFEEKDGILWIHDRTSPDKKWFCRLGLHGEVVVDFGVVTRLLDSKTGHSMVSVAGITAPGTDAAAQFVSDPEYLVRVGPDSASRMGEEKHASRCADIRYRCGRQPASRGCSLFLVKLAAPSSWIPKEDFLIPSQESTETNQRISPGRSPPPHFQRLGHEEISPVRADPPITIDMLPPRLSLWTGLNLCLCMQRI